MESFSERASAREGSRVPDDRRFVVVDLHTGKIEYVATASSLFLTNEDDDELCDFVLGAKAHDTAMFGGGAAAWFGVACVSAAEVEAAS